MFNQTKIITKHKLQFFVSKVPFFVAQHNFLPEIEINIFSLICNQYKLMKKYSSNTDDADNDNDADVVD